MEEKNKQLSSKLQAALAQVNSQQKELMAMADAKEALEKDLANKADEQTELLKEKTSFESELNQLREQLRMVSAELKERKSEIQRSEEGVLPKEQQDLLVSSLISYILVCRYCDIVKTSCRLLFCAVCSNTIVD